MRLMRFRTWIAPFTSSLIVIIAVSAHAQNPSGRPEEPSKTKKPAAKTKPKPIPEPPSVTLTVMTDPADCEVYINGERRGSTGVDGKIQFSKLPVAQYSIEARKQGYTSLLRGFNAGSEPPTLLFKLIARLDDVVAEFNALVDAGKLTPPDTPNALDIVRKVSVTHAERSEVTRMRSHLAERLIDKATPLIDRTISEWRTIRREDLAAARDFTAHAIELNAEDKHLKSRAAYFGALLAFRDWLASKPAAESTAPPEPTLTDAQLIERARGGLAMATELDDAWAAAQYQYGTVLLASGNTAAAEAAFVRAAALEPRWPAVHNGLGAAYYAGYKLKEAVAEYQSALGLDSKSAVAYAGLGLARAARGDTSAGIKDVQRAMELDPTSALPYFNLGVIYSLSKKEKEAARAVEPLKKAIQMNPQNLEFRNSVADRIIADVQKKKKK